MAELAAPAGRHAAAAAEAPQQAGPQLRRAATDSVLGALRWVDVRSGGDLEQGVREAAQLAQQQEEQGGEGLGATASGLAAAAAAWAAAALRDSSGARDASSSSGGLRQEEDQGQLYWWQRWGGRQRAAQQAVELARAPVGRPAAPLRRCQSALDPLQHDSDQPGHVAVPINTRSMFEQAAQGSAGGSGSKRGSGHGGSAAGAAAAPGVTAGGGPSHQEVLPYRLQAVGHSLGAATLLMYAVVCRMRGQPHRLRRLVLMSPAGFHPTVPLVRWRVAMGAGWVEGARARQLQSAQAAHEAAASNGLCAATTFLSLCRRYPTAGPAVVHACPARCRMAAGPPPRAARARHGPAPALAPAALHHVQVHHGGWPPLRTIASHIRQIYQSTLPACHMRTPVMRRTEAALMRHVADPPQPPSLVLPELGCAHARLVAQLLCAHPTRRRTCATCPPCKT